MTRPLHLVRRWWRLSERAPWLSASPAARSLPPPAPPWHSTLESAGIPTTLNYPSTTLSRVVDQAAERYGDNTAVIYNDRSWSYRQLLGDVNRIAGGLARLGVRRRDRVLLAIPNCPEFVASFFAVQKLGAVAVNVGPLMGVDDLEKALAISTPQVAIALDLKAPALAAAARHCTIEHWVWTSLQIYQTPLDRLGYRVKRWYGGNGFSGPADHTTLEDLMAEAPPRPPTLEPRPDDVALLQPTGGTTGTFKLAQLTHRNLLANTAQISLAMGCRLGQDTMVATLPMFHVYGLTTGLMVGMFNALRLIVFTRFDAERYLQVLHRYHPAICPLVPASLEALCDEIEKSTSRRPLGIRLCLSGAAPLPPTLAQRFQRLTGVEVIEGYGLTEAAPVTHVNFPGRSRAGSIGVPLPDTLARIVASDGSGRPCPTGEPGELLVSGPQVMAGYFGDPDGSRAVLEADDDGRIWLHTGDIAAMDEQGYFRILDRKKDMINRSGLKVYPSQVEQVLLSHPRVKDAAVFGREDAVHTEEVVGAIVTDAGDDAHTALAEELRSLCRQRLAAYQVPGRFEFVESIPRTPLGKVRRSILRQRAAGELETAPAQPLLAAPDEPAPGDTMIPAQPEEAA